MIAKADFNEPIKVEDHLGIVCSLVLKFVRKGAVEDSELYSVGCLALVEAARTFDPSKSKFCTWAYLIVRQRIIDEVRRAKRLKEDSSFAVPDVPEAPSNSTPVHILDEIVGPSSSDDSTKMLLGHYLDGKSLSELGREFGFSKEWVRKKIQSAATKIRESGRQIMEDQL